MVTFTINQEDISLPRVQRASSHETQRRTNFPGRDHKAQGSARSPSLGAAQAPEEKVSLPSLVFSDLSLK